MLLLSPRPVTIIISKNARLKSPLAVVEDNMSSIKIRIKLLENDITQVRALIAHPMETGYKRDEKGNKIPAHYIQELTVKHNDKVITNSIMGSGISRNPYFAFKFKGGKSGDKITISWVDNLGFTASEKKHIK